MIIEGFGGAGGWAVASERLGLGRHVGIEWDAAACATRAAAGHATIRADITAFDVGPLAGKVTGAVFSPECTTFSRAGSMGGVGVMDVLDALIRDMFEGGQTRAAHRREMARLLRRAGWPAARTRASRYNRDLKVPVRLTREQRSAAIWKAVRSASLVAEPARFIAACAPEWVAMEQVPAVLPLWEVYADELRKRGYSTWHGKLNAADYGVPQTRERAILIASRVRTVGRPVPTHSDSRRPPQLFTEPWVSMSSALGWGATGRPVPTVTAGGTATGGAEPFGHRDRDSLKREQEAGRWILQGPYRDSPGDRTRPRTMDEPATTVAFGHSSMVLRRTDARVAEGDGGEERAWRFRNNNNNNACERGMDEPAGTRFFGGRSNWAAWVADRPATTVLGDPRLGRPGHKGRESGGESFYAVDSVRISPEEAAALQAFPPGYAWQGTKTARYQQCGNAFPPLVAIAVLGEAVGAPWQDVAERYSAECYGTAGKQEIREVAS